MNNERTAAQVNRQRARSRRTGKYAKHNPCEVCGKSAGYNYFSHDRLEEEPFYGRGICLCAKCCEKVNSLPADEAMALLKKVPS